MGRGATQSRTCFAFLGLILYLCRHLLFRTVMSPWLCGRTTWRKESLWDDWRLCPTISDQGLCNKTDQMPKTFESCEEGKINKLEHANISYCRCRRSPRKESYSWHSKTISKKKHQGISQYTWGFESFFLAPHGSHQRNALYHWPLTFMKLWQQKHLHSLTKNAPVRNLSQKNLLGLFT